MAEFPFLEETRTELYVSLGALLSVLMVLVQRNMHNYVHAAVYDEPCTFLWVDLFRCHAIFNLVSK
jgi:hypothetical protein